MDCKKLLTFVFLILSVLVLAVFLDGIFFVTI